MQTNGHGNDGLMIAVPVGVSVIIGVILAGGPSNAIEIVDAMLRDFAHGVMTVFNGRF